MLRSKALRRAFSQQTRTFPSLVVVCCSLDLIKRVQNNGVTERQSARGGRLRLGGKGLLFSRSTADRGVQYERHRNRAAKREQLIDSRRFLRLLLAMKTRGSAALPAGCTFMGLTITTTVYNVSMGPSSAPILWCSPLLPSGPRGGRVAAYHAHLRLAGVRGSGKSV